VDAGVELLFSDETDPSPESAGVSASVATPLISPSPRPLQESDVLAGVDQFFEFKGANDSANEGLAVAWDGLK